MNDLLSIGRLAEAAGVNVETIRYYPRAWLARMALTSQPLSWQQSAIG